jgi:hypothetical protein
MVSSFLTLVLTIAQLIVRLTAPVVAACLRQQPVQIQQITPNNDLLTDSNDALKFLKILLFFLFIPAY